MRAADVDRAAVADRLGAAMTTGRLTVAEYDERLARAYDARTYGELAALTTDLPPTTAPVSLTKQSAPPSSASACAGPGGAQLADAWRNWLVTAVIVLGVWTLTSVSAGQVLYPWPVWVIGPWGVVLLSQTLTRRGRDQLPG
nr:DUF1707 domain-containing protein [Modestobacter muralis]